jgi:deoxyribonuclease V
MKIPSTPHRWHVTPRRAVAIQRELAGRVRAVKPRRAIRLVAGLDSAFSRDGRHCIGGVVLWDLARQEVVEQRVALRAARFPYVPGLLSFREAPALLAALRALRTAPDALMCDGQGVAHPRRFGIACHLGVIVGLPTIGCAKSRLIGEYVEPGRRRGARSPLREGGERLGTVLRTREKVKPVFVSVGHRIDLATAEQIVLESAIRYRLPEPTRLADRLVAARRRAATIGA